MFGSLFFGWAGGRWNKFALLGGIYISRFYFCVPPSPTNTLVFAAGMGFVWIGVGLLVAGAVGDMFGLRWQVMIQGIAFMRHQLRSFVGAFGGGVVYDAIGSCALALQVGVGLGLTGGAVPIPFGLARPSH